MVSWIWIRCSQPVTRIYPQDAQSRGCAFGGFDGTLEQRLQR